MRVIENEFLRISIACKGAELQQIIDKRTGKEVLWSGDSRYWGKHSPVLFPIVGALKDDTYYFKGKSYQLSRHGFARDFYFDIVSEQPSDVCFALRDSLESRVKYPFKFELQISYKLSGPCLEVSYVVSNPSSQVLLFSLGAHPAFAVVSDIDLKYADYCVSFREDQSLFCHKIVDNLISDQTYEIPLVDGKLPLHHSLFYDDALVITGLKSKIISLSNSRNSQSIEFEFDDAPFFGIWSAKDADFVCLEPWWGIADSQNTNQDFESKRGIIKLAPGSVWNKKWSVRVFE